MKLPDANGCFPLVPRFTLTTSPQRKSPRFGKLPPKASSVLPGLAQRLAHFSVRIIVKEAKLSAISKTVHISRSARHPAWATVPQSLALAIYHYQHPTQKGCKDSPHRPTSCWADGRPCLRGNGEMARAKRKKESWGSKKNCRMRPSVRLSALSIAIKYFTDILLLLLLCLFTSAAIAVERGSTPQVRCSHLKKSRKNDRTNERNGNHRALRITKIYGGDLFMNASFHQSAGHCRHWYTLPALSFCVYWMYVWGRCRERKEASFCFPRPFFLCNVKHLQRENKHIENKNQYSKQTHFFGFDFGMINFAFNTNDQHCKKKMLCRHYFFITQHKIKKKLFFVSLWFSSLYDILRALHFMMIYCVNVPTV